MQNEIKDISNTLENTRKKQLELFEPYELDANKSYEQFLWQKSGQQTIYWPTQREWDEMCEQQSHMTQQD